MPQKSATVGPLAMPILALVMIWLMSATGASADGTHHVVDLSVVDGQVVDMNDPIRIDQGDTLVLRWTVDHPMEIDVHAFHLSIDAHPGAVAEMTIEGSATGRFPITSHAADGSHGTLHYLEIHPR